VQESLTNVVKHAHARHVSILLALREGRAVKVVIEDDGHGFDVAESANGGFGLMGMRERLALLGGRLQIESNGETGTTVAAEVPVA
jgi:signal transduction histidine kinase